MLENYMSQSWEIISEAGRSVNWKEGVWTRRRECELEGGWGYKQSKPVSSEALSPGKFQQGPNQCHQLGGIFKSLIPRATGGSIEEWLQNIHCELQGSHSREEFKLSLWGHKAAESRNVWGAKNWRLGRQVVAIISLLEYFCFKAQTTNKTLFIVPKFLNQRS